MIEKFLYIAFIYFFIVISFCFLVPFLRNISDEGIDGIKETLDMFTDKDFYLDLVVPIIIHFGSIFIFCTLIIFVISLVIK